MKVYIVEINENHINNTEEEQFLSILPAARQEKLLRFKFKKDFLLSLYGELLLRYALCDLYRYIGPVELYHGEHKKPYLRKPDIFFNISHSGSYVACAIGDSEIGVDIQQQGEVGGDLMSLGKNFFSVKEYHDMVQSTDKNDYFYYLWTLKESYIKYLGSGLYKSLKSFWFTSSDGTIVCEDSKDGQLTLNFRCIDFAGKYKLAVCTQEPVFEGFYTVINKNSIDVFIKKNLHTFS